MDLLDACYITRRILKGKVTVFMVFMLVMLSILSAISAAVKIGNYAGISTAQKSKMEKVTDVQIYPLQDSIYVKPFTMHFVQNGRRKTWDLLNVHDSVAIILFNISRNVLILVKQFRPAVYFNGIPKEDRKNPIDTEKYPAKLGITIEFCAGIVDKTASLVQIAKEEILEECGYDVNISSIERVATYRAGVGTSGSTQTCYYCEVTDDMKVTTGGGIDDEIIEVIEMTVPELKKYVSQPDILSPPSFLFGVHWFLLNKQKYVH